VARCVARVAKVVSADATTATLAAARAAAPKPSSSSGRFVLWPNEASDGAPPTPPSCAWWAARTGLVHQRLLSGRSPTLRGSLLGLHALTLAVYAPNNAPPGAGGGGSNAGAPPIKRLDTPYPTAGAGLGLEGMAGGVRGSSGDLEAAAGENTSGAADAKVGRCRLTVLKTALKAPMV